MSGGGGTTTTVQNSTPFNANQLNAVQNSAISLGTNNPINYTPGQTLAYPNDVQLNALNGAAAYGQNAGNNAAAYTPQLQATALSNNNALAGGTPWAAIQPTIGAYEGYSGINPAWQGMNALSPIASGADQNPGLVSQLSNVGNNAQGNVSPYASALGNTGNNAAGAVQPYANSLAHVGVGGTAWNALSGAANGNYLNGAQPYLDALNHVASTGAAANDLRNTANGNFLGQNPYLNAAFNAAANPVIRAYQTATAPQTDSRMEAAGRFNSGAGANAQSVNQANLAEGLATLSAGIYQPAYQQERQLMTQAAGQLGGLQTDALTNALSGYGNQVGLLSNAASNLGGMQTQALGTAGGLVNNANNVASNAYSAGGALLNNAGTVGANALSNALSGYNTGVNTMANAGNTLGQLGVSGVNSQSGILQNIINDYATYNNQQQNAINSTPALSMMAPNDFQAQLSAGQAQHAFQQQGLNDWNNRFYGNEMAPWTTLGQEAAIVGGGIPGQSTLTQPYYTNPAGQVLGGLGAGVGLANGIGSLTSGSGLLGAASLAAK